MTIFKIFHYFPVALICCSCAANLHEPDPDIKSLKFDHSIPLEIVNYNYNTVIFLNAKVDGEKEHFLFDTGCYETVIANSGIFEKYPVVQNLDIKGVYSADRKAEIHVNSVTAGDVTLPLRFILRSNTEKSRDGILGIDALKDSIFVLDFSQGHRARLSIEDQFPPELHQSPLHRGHGRSPVYRRGHRRRIGARTV